MSSIVGWGPGPRGGSGGTNTNGCGAIFDTGTGATTCIAPTYGGNANNSILTQTGSIALPNSTVGGLNGSLNSADWTKLIAAALAAAALGAIAGQALANQNQSQSQSQSDSGTADDSDSSTEPVGADASGLDLEKADERYIERVTGESAHAIKGDIVGPKNGSRYDIYVDKKTGEIYVLGKGGVGEPQPTGLKVPR